MVLRQSRQYKYHTTQYIRSTGKHQFTNAGRSYLSK
jgi:hypothetical protein